MGDAGGRRAARAIVGLDTRCPQVQELGRGGTQQRGHVHMDQVDLAAFRHLGIAAQVVKCVLSEQPHTPGPTPVFAGTADALYAAILDRIQWFGLPPPLAQPGGTPR